MRDPGRFPLARRHARLSLSTAFSLIALFSLSAPVALGNPSPTSYATLWGTAGLLRVRSGELQTRGVLALSLGSHYYESYDLSLALGTDDPGRYVTLHLDGSIGVTDWLELGVDVPFRRAAWKIDDGANVRGEVLDNPALSAKLSLLQSSMHYLLAVEGRARLPLQGELTIGDGEGETYYLAGGTKTDWEAVLLATADFTPRVPLRLHANVGWAFHGDEARGRRFFPDYYLPVSQGGRASDNDALILRGAVEFPGRTVDLFTEFVGDVTRDPDLVSLKENPFSITPGMRVRFAGDWSATAGLTVALSGDDRGTPAFDPHAAYPDWEASFAISRAWPVFAADTDGDGIPDFRDNCRRQPEDFDGFEDTDGCPDLDNDGDGIPDSLDACPNDAEDFDGFEDTDGCPDLDNDGDGIVDARDMCPNEPEDLDGFEDTDGCPDP
jgi:hypothetical protein